MTAPDRPQGSAAKVLAWCDHIEANAARPAETTFYGFQKAYADGFHDGVLELLAQVRQAVLHDFDLAALDGKALT